MSERAMRDIRVGLPTVIMIVVVVGAGAFAAGRGLPAAPPPARAEPPPIAAVPTAAEDEGEGEDMLPAGHPPTGQGTGGMDLPAGHPPIDSTQQPGAMGGELPAAEPSSLEWTAPARWQVVPNASTMRLATLRIPHAAGDTVDPELSITQAGGSADANVERWIGQFDAEARKTAKRTARKVGALDVAIVDVQGTYSGGMGKEGSSQPGWALLGAIVSTPGMPHFFKLTGPAKSVAAARGEFDAMIGSVRPRGT